MLQFNGLDETITALSAIENYQWGNTFKRFYSERFQPITVSRYSYTMAQTPYAPSSLGTRKRVTGAIRGQAGDPGYSYDSGALYSQITGNVQFMDDGMVIWSDLIYGGYQEALWQAKGPFDEGVLFANDTDLMMAGEMMLGDMEKVWAS